MDIRLLTGEFNLPPDLFPEKKEVVRRKTKRRKPKAVLLSKLEQMPTSFTAVDWAKKYPKNTASNWYHTLARLAAHGLLTETPHPTKVQSVFTKRDA